MIHDFDKAIETIEERIAQNDISGLNALLASFHPGDLAFIANHLASEDLPPFLEQVRRLEDLHEMIFLLDPEPAEYLIRLLPAAEVKKLFSILDTDDSAKIISFLPPELASWVFEHLEPESNQDASTLLQYEDETAGRIMSLDYVSLSAEATVEEAFEMLKRAVDAETIYTLYIVYEWRKLVGVCSLRELLHEPNKKKLKEFMAQEVIAVNAAMDREEVVKYFERHHLNALPVVDAQHRLVGVITVDDVIHVLRSEATEDIMMQVGTTEDEFRLQSPLKGFRRRMPWLLVSFFGGMLTIQTNIYFAGLIHQVEFLAFITVIAGMGGNIASQSSTIVVRGLATGKILVGELWEVLIKEVSIGAMLGLFFGLLLGGLASLQFSQISMIGLSVMAGMIFSMLIAACVGSLLPMIFQRFQIDPAVATGPFVSTTIDNLGLLGYFGSVYLILRHVTPT